MIKEKNIFMTKLWDLLTDKIGSGWKEKYEKEKKKSQESSDLQIHNRRTLEGWKVADRHNREVH